MSTGYVVFLSNRVHPDGKGDVTALRGRVATVAAAALLSSTDVVRRQVVGAAAAAPTAIGSNSGAGAVTRSGTGPVLTGIDVLAADGFAVLRGKRVGLLTNQTGRSRSGESTIDLLARAPGVSLRALFSPEHGIRGQLDDKVASSKDEQSGLPIYSLYGDSRRPAATMLAGLDTIVIDLQDIGARFYTFPATVAYVLEEAARARISVVVLDRPNPCRWR